MTLLGSRHENYSMILFVLQYKTYLTTRFVLRHEIYIKNKQEVLNKTPLQRITITRHHKHIRVKNLIYVFIHFYPASPIMHPKEQRQKAEKKSECPCLAEASRNKQRGKYQVSHPTPLYSK